MGKRAALLGGLLAVTGLLVVSESCVGDSPAVTPDAGGNDAAPDTGCPTGQTTCGAACVDLKTDNANCGGCGKPCTGADKCSEGVCGGAKAIAIATGGYAAYAALASGSVWTWGFGEDAQLGVAPSDLTQVCSGFGLSKKCRAAPAPIANLTDVQKIAASVNTACALKRDATVWCWGNNAAGQLGHIAGSSGDILCGATACNPKPTQVTIPAASAIAVGENNACAVVTPSGDLYCWGNDDFGQTSGTLPAAKGGRLGPTKIPLPRPAQQVAGGSSFTCAVLDNGNVWCWGANDIGNLGHAAGTAPDRAPCHGDGGAGIPCGPPSVVRDANAVPFPGVVPGTLRLGSGVACAVSANDTLWCWGNNDSGQFGATTPPDSPYPVKVPGNFIAADIGDSVCGVTAASDVYCWSVNFLGAIGLGSTAPGAACSWDAFYHCLTPPTILPNLKARRVALGASFALALTGEGRVWGWGMNHFGQAGHPPGTNGDVTNTTKSGNPGPVAMSPLEVQGLPIP